MATRALQRHADPAGPQGSGGGKAARRRGPWLSFRRRQSLFAYSLLAPAVLFVAALIAYPIVMVARLAFLEGRFSSLLEASEHDVGLGQFRAVLSDPETWRSLYLSVIYVVGSVLPAFLIGLALALLLRETFRGRRWLRTVILLPWAIPGVLASAAFLWMLDQSFGVINKIAVNLHLLETPIGWYSNPSTAMIGVIVPTAWKLYPFFMIVLLAALQGVPQELYEAARMDGAGPIMQFWNVTWPNIRSAAYIVIIISALGTFREFDFIYPLTHGGPSGATSTLAIRMYESAFQFSNMGYAAATGIVSTVFAVLFVLLVAKKLRTD